MKRLGINIDHVATIRNARGEGHPDILNAAKHVMKLGADSITIHLNLCLQISSRILYSSSSISIFKIEFLGFKLWTLRICFNEKENYVLSQNLEFKFLAFSNNHTLFIIKSLILELLDLLIKLNSVN